MKRNVLDFFENSCHAFPDGIAFSDEKNRVKYSEAHLKTKSIGTFIAGKGYSNRAVLVLMDKSAEALITYFGVVYSGNFYVPIDVKSPNERIEKIIDTVDPCLIISDHELLDKAGSLEAECEVISYSDIESNGIDDELLDSIRKKTIDTDPVYALFTSGSTGIPKGVVCCHRSVIDYTYWLLATFGFNEKTIFGNQTPFYFSMSVLDIYASIGAGAELSIIPKTLFSFPPSLVEYLNEKKINTIYWVPTALCALTNKDFLDRVELPYLKKVLFAGELMPMKHLNIWRRNLPNALFANLFGPTEITDIGLFYIVDREFDDNEMLPIGKTCDNVGAFILDENDKQITDDRIGELCFRGSYLALGYYNDFQKTATCFTQNPLNSVYPEIIYRTGDLVSINEYDEYVFHGRKDHQIKHLGHRIELGEIEAAASSIQEVMINACIYDKDEDKLILYYSGSIDEVEVRKNLVSSLPVYMVPNEYHKIEKMPLNMNGKIDRKQLQKMKG